MKLKSEHWACIAFFLVAVLLFLHGQRAGYKSSASVTIDNSLLDASITSMAFA